MTLRFRLWLHRGVVLAALFLGARTAFGQSPAPPGMNLFGDDLVIKPAARQPQATSLSPPAPTPGLEQTVFFAEGSQLRGELTSLENGEVHWNRPDFSAPFAFDNGQLKKVVLGSGDGWIESGRLAVGSNEYPLRATVTLAGGDWLFGDLVSTDGNSFDIAVGDRTFHLARSQIISIRIARRPSPEFAGCSGIDRSIERHIQGFLVLPVGQFVGTIIPGDGSFALSFELEQNSDDGARLVFGPFGPDPVGGYPGAYYIRLGEKELSYCLKSTEKPLTDFFQNPVPAAAQRTGPIRYFVLYDAKEQRFRVYRNGCITLDFGHLETNAPFLQSVCLIPPSRAYPFRSEPRPLHVRGFRVVPWDREVPAEPEPKMAGDELIGTGHLYVDGELEAISAAELKFSGSTRPLRDGLEIRFASAPEGSETSKCRVIYGSNGEFDVDRLQIANGKAHFRTAFAADLEVPVSLVSGVVFPPVPGETKEDDSIIFQDGEILNGKFASEASGKPLGWESRTGQKIEVQPDQVAGVLLHHRDGAVGESPGLVEFQNGDRLRGELRDFDKKRAVFHEPVLGNLPLDPARLSRLFLSAHWSPRDVDSVFNNEHVHSGAELRDFRVQFTAQPRDIASENLDSYAQFTPQPRGLYLDGNFMSWIEYTSDGMTPTFSESIILSQVDMPDQYELSFDVTSITANAPGFRILLADSAGINASMLILANGELHLLDKALNGKHRSEKISDLSTRLSTRVFIDAKAGSLSLFCDGVRILEHRGGAEECVPGVGKELILSTFVSPVSVASNLRVSPWTGILPTETVPGPHVALTNGDAAGGKIEEIREGRIQVDTDAGLVEFPVDEIQSVVFSDDFQPAHAAARLRLVDGSVIHADTFQWDNDELTAHSQTLGDMHIAGSDLAELVLHPAPMRVPLPLKLRKK